MHVLGVAVMNWTKMHMWMVASIKREAWWPSGRATDSGARGRGFNPHSGHRVVSLRKIHLPPKKNW